MSDFGKTLARLRSESGFKSAKSFYEYLHERGLECNYQYYMKVEKSQAFPSSVIVNQMAKAMSAENGQNLIMAYCRNQFQSFEFLFKDQKPIEDNSISSKATSVAQGQRELSLRQIEVLAQKEENYFLFLLLTLSRGPVSIQEIRQYHGLQGSIDELVQANILLLQNDHIQSTSSEFRFPLSQDEKVIKAYQKFDHWDNEFSSQFDFERLVNKMMIRRISPRYLSAIKKQIDTIADFVRLSDEADQKHNNDVLHLQIQLSRGEIPG
ncbi:hypothetical protein [Bacteriovorax sp. DB6_IX]|uniref:hypothetical protein n=1 Tax=Bacteriovorax sp. DB6_IX TaxID=1353530 RepID=UPI000389E07E|nr:hypothetical protein [Bacteriovorax sp. DB6_IX]EQC51002.1 hypothetical protein M901_1327 [Bacteriovorax sp. DB6_IX]